MSLSRALSRLAAELGPDEVRLDGLVLTARPAAADEVAFAVRVAREEALGLAMGRPVAVPPGDGSAPAAIDERPEGVANGSARAGRLHLDPERLTALLCIDESSLLVHAQAGMRLDALAARLAAVGMTLGALSADSLGRTLGALMAAPRPSEATPRGRLVDLCAAVEAVLPDGTRIGTHLAPRKATGPDFLWALLGARGTTGLITSVWLRAARRPPRRLYAGYAIPSAERALAVAQTLLDRGARPADSVLADLTGLGAVDPTGLSASLAPGEVLLALHFDGTPEMLDAEESLALALATTGAPGAAGRAGATSANGAGGRALSPPLVETFLLRPPPFAVTSDVFVPRAALASRWAARQGPAILSGFRPAGAALLSTTAPDPTARAPSSLGPSSMVRTLRDALRRRLDPSGLLSSRPSPPSNSGD